MAGMAFASENNFSVLDGRIVRRNWPYNWLAAPNGTTSDGYNCRGYQRQNRVTSQIHHGLPVMGERAAVGPADTAALREGLVRSV
jgi:hypothetical protein